MKEQFPTPTFEKEMTKEERLQLAKELSQKKEGFLFEGLDEEAYAKMKATDEEYPGMTTPIDELLKRFAERGVKVSFSRKHPDSGNVYILPLDSDDIENDSVSPDQLKTTETMDAGLKKLVEFDKASIPKKP